MLFRSPWGRGVWRGAHQPGACAAIFTLEPVDRGITRPAPWCYPLNLNDFHCLSVLGTGRFLLLIIA